MKQLIARIQRLVRLSRFPETSCHAPRPASSDDRATTTTTTTTTTTATRNMFPTTGASPAVMENAPMEKLPAELRDQILCQLDFDGLRNLTEASPVFLQQYAVNRAAISSQCLESTLGSAALDAYWAFKTSSWVCRPGCAAPANMVTPPQMTAFNKTYQEQHSAPSFSLLDQGLSKEDLSQIGNFHCSVVAPLLRVFTQEALAKLSEETGNPVYDEPLGEMEQARLLRAFYRFELVCHILSNGKFKVDHLFADDGWSGELLWSFLDAYEPWELEEIACVYSFVKRNFEKVFDDIRGDFDEKNPKFQGLRLGTPSWSWNLDPASWRRDMLLEGTTCRGLGLLHEALFRAKNHKHLVSTMKENITYGGNSIQYDILGESAQYFRLHAHFTDRDWKEQRRETMLFGGDDGASPPLAWTLMWDGTYSNKYGYLIAEDIRRWGYVMWDASRMEKSGAKGVLKRQWDEFWGNDDPRYEGL